MPTSSRTIHASRKGRPITSEDLWRIPRVGAPVASRDGRSCAVTVTTYDVEKNEGRGRIWLSGPAGLRPLTASGSSCGSPAFSPDGGRMAFVRKDARGKRQVCVMPVDGGEAESLTDLPLGAFDPRFLPDGSALVLGVTLLKGHLTVEATRAEAERREKDPVKAHVTEDRVYRYWDAWLTGGEVPHLFLLDLATSALVDLMPASTAWFDWMEPEGQYDIGPDGREVAYAASSYEEDRKLLRSSIHVVALAGHAPAGPPQEITPGHPADDARPRYSRDGARIFYGMAHDPLFYADRIRLMAYERASGKHEVVLGDWAHSPSSWDVAHDGSLLFLAEVDARTHLYRLDPSPGGATPEPRRVVEGGHVSAHAPAADGRVFFTMDSLCAPPELHVVAPAPRGPAIEQLTRFSELVLAEVAMGEVRDYRYQGAAGEEVQMFVVLPPGHEPGRRVPLVQVIHGGPHGISGDQFHFRWNAQAFAAPGHAVAQVNFQGSTSWGQDFAARIQGDWAERPFEDIMRACDVLVAEGVADPDRMAATGGSYGGYMAAWICGHTDRFRCIVNHAGVFDTLAEYGCDVTQGRARAFGGEPWEGIEGIDRANPVRFAGGFTTPMLVVHGALDYRVPADQGLECYGILKAKGVPARLVYFPDEGHWVQKPKNSLLWYHEVLGWISRWLAR